MKLINPKYNLITTFVWLQNRTNSSRLHNTIAYRCCTMTNRLKTTWIQFAILKKTFLTSPVHFYDRKTLKITTANHENIDTTVRKEKFKNTREDKVLDFNNFDWELFQIKTQNVIVCVRTPKT